MFLEVALPLPLLQTFTYRCPSDIFHQAQPGQRVLVPFRNQRVSGFVVKKTERPPMDLPANTTLKEVLELIDPPNLISPEIFQLAEWISDYYFASRGEVLRSCLPPKSNPRLHKIVVLLQGGLDVLERDEQTAELPLKERQLLRVLGEHQALGLKELAQRAGFEAGERDLRRLVSNQCVQIQHRLAGPAVTPRFQKSVALRTGTAVEALKLTVQQNKVVQSLRARQGPVPVAVLLEELSISRSALNSLQQRGLVVFSSEAVRRDPLKSVAALSSSNQREHTSEQVSVLKELHEALSSAAFVPALLHGVTGSGKTEVYLCLIEATLQRGKTALMLMPEIGLTPRVAEEFRQRLGPDIAILHSGLSEGERFDEWWRIKRGEARVVIGTRSALFAPLENLGLIVVDEEHDPSYKQQESPRYHARDTALVRGKLAKALVILGSATPAVETFHNARSSKYRYLRMKSRVQSRPLPEVTLVNMREEFKTSGKPAVFSGTLLAQVAQRLERKEQVLVLLNRRGFSASVLCRSCGQNIQCRNCSISLTFHRAASQLVCHYCSYEQRVPKFCPRCSSEHLYFQGDGTEKVEALLEKLFPKARIARLDRDTVQRKNAHATILRRFQNGETDILAGTQMISKGHDFHNVTLAAILSADSSLSFPDFRCAERTFHLLSQMSGRPGRGELPGQVLIQTFHPEHYCLKLVAQHDYEGFFEKEIRFRKMMHYPPFTSLANLLVRHRNLDKAAQLINSIGKIVQKLAAGQMRLLGPALSPLAKLKSEHRFQLLIKARTRQQLREVLKQSLKLAEEEGLETSKIHVDIDPQNIM
ncbi:MAG: primosomal protein N' [Acidobacteria bacterium]|nr:primosomal protein N' [Acidobacteriota bacterium]